MRSRVCRSHGAEGWSSRNCGDCGQGFTVKYNFHWPLSEQNRYAIPEGAREAHGGSTVVKDRVERSGGAQREGRRPFRATVLGGAGDENCRTVHNE